MSASSTNRFAFHGTDFIAMVLIALGMVVAGGWLAERPMTVVVGLDRLAMTFNSALCFILAGFALSVGRPAVRLSLAMLIGAISVLTLCEHIFARDLHIDQLFGASWILESAPHPGRMAPQMAASFALVALALAQLTRRQASRLDWIAPLAAGFVFLIAVVSLCSRLLRLDLVYDWNYTARVAPHAAAGLLLLSFGLAQLTYRRSMNASNDVANDAHRILAVSTASMLAITIACAAICFAVVVRHSHDLQQAALKRELQNQVELIGAEIAVQRQEAERLMTSQSLHEIIRRPRRANAQTPSPAVIQALQDWGDRGLPTRGLLAVDLADEAGRPLLRLGSFGAPPSVVVSLDDAARLEIGTEARLLIQRSLPSDVSNRGVTMKMQLSLPRLTAILHSETSGNGFNTAICHALTAHSMQCLRLSSSPVAGLPVARDMADRAAALNLAFNGQTGVTLGAERDGARFFAAYGPIKTTPLAMTLTTPLDGLYTDLRQRLNFLLALMIGLVAAAAWLLRWQIAPLIAKVVAARSRANDSAMHFTAVMDTAGDGIITVNRAGLVLSANPAFRRLLALKTVGPIRENLTELLPGLELRRDDYEAPSLAHCAGQTPMDFLRETGDVKDQYLQVEFAWLDQATRSTLVATVRDLTLLKRGELELRETHARLQHSERLYRDQATRLATLFDSVEDAIVIINKSGHIESWNLGAQHLFGYAAEDIIGKDVRLLMTEPHASAYRTQLLRLVQTGERTATSGRIEMEGRHGSGRTFPIEMSVREMIIEGERLYGAVMHDISVRREVERMKSEFVSTISHELRTPLTSISGSLALISGGAVGETPPKVARLVGIARQNAERLIRLINDILDLEKAEAGKLDFQLHVRSLRSVVGEVAEFNRGFAQSLGIAIELQEGDDADVLIDSDRLTQVLTNLISNASKFSPPGGVVRIRIDRETSGVRVTVSDTGPGIAPEFRGRIFHKFAQGDASDSRAKGGTGLGLSIAKTLTEKLGGHIGFDSVPGEGANFYIVLPIHGQATDARSMVDWQGDGALAEEILAEVQRRATTAHRESLPQILHVEDDQSLTAIVREAMSRNAVVTSARSLAAARQFLAACRFDAVILDVALPDGSGLELLPIAVGEGERAPVIVSYTADEPGRVWKAHVDAALVKSRHSVSQLMVTVLTRISDRPSSDERPVGELSSRP